MKRCVKIYWSRVFCVLRFSCLQLELCYCMIWYSNLTMAASTDDERCVNPNKTLGLDEACLRIINDQNKSASIYTHPSECKPVNIFMINLKITNLHKLTDMGVFCVIVLGMAVCKFRTKQRHNSRSSHNIRDSLVLYCW